MTFLTEVSLGFQKLFLEVPLGEQHERESRSDQDAKNQQEHFGIDGVDHFLRDLAEPEYGPSQELSRNKASACIQALIAAAQVNPAPVVHA